MLPHLKIPNIWSPPVYNEICSQSAQLSLAAGGQGTANNAYYVPIIFPINATITSVSFVAANGTGNYDLGFYDGYSLALIASKGSTAMTAAGTKTLTFSAPQRVIAGKLYYAGAVFSSTSGQFWAIVTAVVLSIAVGIGQEASALPLPSTMTPVTPTNTRMPLFVFGVQ